MRGLGWRLIYYSCYVIWEIYTVAHVKRDDRIADGLSIFPLLGFILINYNSCTLGGWLKDWPPKCDTIC